MQEHIMEGRIEGMTLRDALEAIPMLAVEDDVLIPLWLIFISRQNGSNLPVAGIRKVVLAAITALIKVKSNLALLIRWQSSGELKCLPVEPDPWMVVVQHVLKLTQHSWIEIGVLSTVETILEGIIWIVDVKLGICRILAFKREEGTCFVGQLSMQLENPWPSTIIDRVIHLVTNRGHCQGIVVGVDVLSELLAERILATVESRQFMGKVMDMWKVDLSLEAAHAKPRILEGRVHQLLSHPVKSMT
jgi:hypothetical protein